MFGSALSYRKISVRPEGTLKFKFYNILMHLIIQLCEMYRFFKIKRVKFEVCSTSAAKMVAKLDDCSYDCGLKHWQDCLSKASAWELLQLYRSIR